MLIEYYLVGVVFLFLFFFLLRGRNNLFLFNHFLFTEFHVKVFLFFLVVAFSFYFVLYATTSSKSEYPVDFFFSLLNLVLLLPFLFCTNNLFTFLFVLEVISCFLFYMLSASKLWYKGVKEKISVTTSNERPVLYVNMIFFQYWVTFFATVLLIYALLCLFYLFGTTEWSVFNILNNSSLLLKYTSTSDSFFISFVLVLSILLKLGIAPVHLFKVETYKGVPYLSILFYTTYYFVVVFFMFLCLLDESIITFVSAYYYLFLFFVSLGLIYIITLLFDVNYLKAFFAYSTVANSLGFLVLFVSRF